MSIQRATRFEYSAGGVVEKDGRLLMVYVKNLEGKRLWTFPKGHIEKGEEPAATALREVEEETGWRCEIVKPLEHVQYWFKREGQLTKKRVTWFLMRPVGETGSYDTEEILDVRWMRLDEAKQCATYRSDKHLLKQLA